MRKLTFDLEQLQDGVRGLPFDAGVSHAAMCAAINVLFKGWHWSVRPNVCLVSGQPRQGKLSFVVYSPSPMALEIDHRAPRQRSLAKLATIGHARVIVLRCPSLPVFPPQGYSVFYPSSRVRDDGGDPCRGPSPAEYKQRQQVVYTTLAQACSILGGVQCSPTSRYGNCVVRVLHRRLHEGFTPPELLLVARRARLRAKNGDRWPHWRNLLYIWGVNFPPLLADAKAFFSSPPPPLSGGRTVSTAVQQEALRRATTYWQTYCTSMGQPIDPHERPEEWDRVVTEKITEVTREWRR